MKRRRRGSIIIGMAVLVLAPALLLSACDDSNEPERRRIVTAEKAHVPEWLPAADGVDPAWWLASRRDLSPAINDNPMISVYRRYLTRAAVLFDEDQRMIANRTAQVAAALDKRGSPETYDAILDGFSEIAEFSGRKLSYGALCQHYLNLRATGESRGEAVEELKRAYPHSP